MNSENFQIPYLNAKSVRDVTNANSSSFFLSFRFLNKEKRKALETVYAFFRIVDDCVDELQNAQQKKHALDFWKSELTQVYHGKPQHPVMQELTRVVRCYDIAEEHFAGLVVGCEMDIEKTRYATLAELNEYCYRVASLVGLVCMQIFGHKTETSKDAAVHLGLAFQFTNILRDVGEDLARGRIYLPQEVLSRFGCSENDLMRGVENENFFSVMNFIFDQAKSHYDMARPEFDKDTNGNLTATLAMARVYESVLHKIKSQNFPVLKKRVRLNFFEKAKLIFPLFFKKAA